MKNPIFDEINETVGVDRRKFGYFRYENIHGHFSILLKSCDFICIRLVQQKHFLKFREMVIAGVHVMKELGTTRNNF